MPEKRRINIDSDDVLGTRKTAAQKQRDNELIDTGSVPADALQGSPEEGDVVAESDPERVLPEDVRILRDRYEEAEKRADEEHDNFLRTLAEFTNYRRRSRRNSIRRAGSPQRISSSACCRSSTTSTGRSRLPRRSATSMPCTAASS